MGPSTAEFCHKGGRVRPIDLARLAGVSTQQVRNYVDAGVLPPAPRTDSGYRTFDERHRQALLTYRALAKGHGWDAARRVMRAVHAGEVPAALALVDAGHADLHEQRRSLDAAGEALEAMAGQDPDGAAVPRAGLLIGEVAGHLRIRTSALRVWEAAGLLAPQRERGTGYRRYGPADVRDARMINLLRQGHYPLTAIQPILDDLRQAGSTGALRAAIAQRHADLTRRTMAMLDAAGELYKYLLNEPEKGADVVHEQVGGL